MSPAVPVSGTGDVPATSAISGTSATSAKVENTKSKPQSQSQPHIPGAPAPKLKKSGLSAKAPKPSKYSKTLNSSTGSASMANTTAGPISATPIPTPVKDTGAVSFSAQDVVLPASQSISHGPVSAVQADSTPVCNKAQSSSLPVSELHTLLTDAEGVPYFDSLQKKYRAMHKRIDRISRYEFNPSESLNADQIDSLKELPLLRGALRELEENLRFLVVSENERAANLKADKDKAIAELSSKHSTDLDSVKLECNNVILCILKMVRELVDLDRSDPVVRSVLYDHLLSKPSPCSFSICDSKIKTANASDVDTDGNEHVAAAAASILTSTSNDERRSKRSRGRGRRAVSDRESKRTDSLEAPKLTDESLLSRARKFALSVHKMIEEPLVNPAVLLADNARLTYHDVYKRLIENPLDFDELYALKVHQDKLRAQKEEEEKKLEYESNRKSGALVNSHSHGSSSQSNMQGSPNMSPGSVPSSRRHLLGLSFMSGEDFLADQQKSEEKPLEFNSSEVSEPSIVAHQHLSGQQSHFQNNNLQQQKITKKNHVQQDVHNNEQPQEARMRSVSQKRIQSPPPNQQLSNSEFLGPQGPKNSLQQQQQQQQNTQKQIAPANEWTSQKPSTNGTQSPTRQPLGLPQPPQYTTRAKDPIDNHTQRHHYQRIPYSRKGNDHHGNVGRKNMPTDTPVSNTIANPTTIKNNNNNNNSNINNSNGNSYAGGARGVSGNSFPAPNESHGNNYVNPSSSRIGGQHRGYAGNSRNGNNGDFRPSDDGFNRRPNRPISSHHATMSSSYGQRNNMASQPRAMASD